MRSRFALTGALLLSLALGACASTAPQASDTPDTTVDGSPSPSAEPSTDADGTLVLVDGSAGGPGISVTDALGSAGDQPVLVNGALFVDPDGTVRLCEAMMESFPPQCGGASLVIEGLDLSGIPDLQEGNGVQWAEMVQLFGNLQPAD